MGKEVLYPHIPQSQTKQEEHNKELRTALRKVIDLTCEIYDNGETWGMDTVVGNIEDLIDKATNILKPYLK